MRLGGIRAPSARRLCLAASLLHLCAALPSTGLTKKDWNPLGIDWYPAPPPEDDPITPDALRDPRYLPAQIGGIVGAYALTLLVIAVALLCVAKRRRQLLRGGEDVDEFGEIPVFQFPAPWEAEEGDPNDPGCPYPVEQPKSPVPNFSYPSPLSPTQAEPQYTYPSPSTSVRPPGIDFAVDQAVVAHDRDMAQQQLEDMYKHVMEQEAAKEAGVEYHPPTMASPQIRASPSTAGPQHQQQQQQQAPLGMLKKERNKPAALNLREEKTQSRASSILSALMSPRKKATRGVSISSPIMTPMSATFPRRDGEEMQQIPPRQYAPPPPPPVPADRGAYGQPRGVITPITPDISPQSTQSIDERLDQLPQQPPAPRERTGGARVPPPISIHNRTTSVATDGGDMSAVSDRSSTPLVGLPTSPKPGVNRFPSLASLPTSPKPGATFQRANAPTAVRTGGTLPLRAYEPSLASPSATSHQTKQTVFERTGPLSPSGMNTPWTGAPVPYTPYQPFSPVIPVTPSLVTKADRKRIKRMEPKTPTMAMVQSSDDVW